MVDIACEYTEPQNLRYHKIRLYLHIIHNYSDIFTYKTLSNEVYHY